MCFLLFSSNRAGLQFLTTKGTCVLFTSKQKHAEWNISNKLVINLVARIQKINHFQILCHKTQIPFHTSRIARMNIKMHTESSFHPSTRKTKIKKNQTFRGFAIFVHRYPLLPVIFHVKICCKKLFKMHNFSFCHKQSSVISLTTFALKDWNNWSTIHLR